MRYLTLGVDLETDAGKFLDNPVGRLVEYYAPLLIKEVHIRCAEVGAQFELLLDLVNVPLGGLVGQCHNEAHFRVGMVLGKILCQ